MTQIAGGTDPIIEAKLVYQAGIASVFIVRRSSTTTRVLMADFKSCEYFVRGMRLAGVPATTWHCDMAGDISLFPTRWQPGPGPLFEEKKGKIF